MEKPQVPESTETKTAFETARSLRAGETIQVGDASHEIRRIENASDLAGQFGLRINRDVPVFFLAGSSPKAQGGYHPEADIILIFENMSDPRTIEHELIHAVEYHMEPTPGLLAVYEKAKAAITEDSFADEFTSFNFRKDIHEFIADGRTKLKEALKKEGLYEEFSRETSYIFE